MRRFTWCAVMAAVLACLAPAAGCGDDDDESTEPSEDWDPFDEEDEGGNDDSDDDGSDDGDNDDGNHAPILNAGYFLINDGVPVDVADGPAYVGQADELGILFDYEDEDCNLDGGVMLIDFHDGSGYGEGPSIEDAGCSTMLSGLILGYLLDLSGIDPGGYTASTKFQDFDGADSNVIDADFHVVE